MGREVSRPRLGDGDGGRVRPARHGRMGFVLGPGPGSPVSITPSSSLGFINGTLQDRKDLSTISFLDLGVVLGHYAKWQDCRDDLGYRYIGRRGETATFKYSY
ncbi:hypothetical protein BSF38_02004 [Paludisphaera borealis]|uniref:Uncharacterized protein n=1 Tax=Paludisphaera borealis TaxID=1387353 RepID=A0A1U7CNS6_9BACT|nr:hypothetical protein BSF38_02004 [Paludisphaera borealis]